MEAKKLLEILSVAEQLKCRTRHCDTSSGRRESVAEHSWRVALMAMLMEDEFPDLDIDKVIRMCLIHDLGEAFTGDIPAFLKKSEDGEKEEAILERWVGDFPAPYNEEWLALLREMDSLETPEAKLYKALDRIEAVIQHNEAPLETWIELERTLNLEYGVEDCAAFPFMSELRELAAQDTREKLARG